MMTATYQGVPTPRALYEQCRELGWPRERAAKIACVDVETAESWDRPAEEAVERIKRDRAKTAARQGTTSGRDRHRRRRPRLLGTVDRIPTGDDEKES